MMVARTATMSDTVRLFWRAVSSCRFLIITSYQWRVGPWMGRVGVEDSSNENATMTTIGRYRKRITNANRARSPQRCSRACRLTGIVSSGSTFLATSVRVLDAQVAAEDDQQDGHEGHDEEAHRGALRD